MTRQQVSWELFDRALKIPGFEFIDAAGRKWSNKSYFDMLARTELMNAGRASYDDKCAKEGFDLMILTVSGDSCDKCARFEGKLFSLSGEIEGVPSKQDLIDAGVFHPNCTHSYSFVPDYVAETKYGIKVNRKTRKEEPEPKVKEEPEAKQEAKQEVKPKAKPVAKPEKKPEVKPEAKPVAKPKAKPETKPEAKPNPPAGKETRAERRARQLETARRNRLLAEAELADADLIVGEHSREEDLLATNPNYATGKDEWTNNCQRCVVAYEARRRGLNVVAKPSPKVDALRYGYAWATIYRGGMQRIVNCSARGAEAAKRKVEARILAAPDGARFIVRIDRKDSSRSGHVFVAEKIDGKIRWLDPQAFGEGKQFDASSNWEKTTGSECVCLRVDNLKFSDTLTSYVSRRGR